MWTTMQEKKLKEIYSNKTNLEIATILNKSKSSIDNKGYRLGLKKSEKFLLCRNKKGHKTKINLGYRDLNYNELKKIFNKYTSIRELKEFDEPAYQSARLKGYLDELTSHMTPFKYSIPQMILEDLMNQLLNLKASYNNRKIIKPYELDLYYKEYKLAFEYQGKYWHTLENNDELKISLTKNKNITLIHIYEKSRNYIKDIKKQINDNLKLINKTTDLTLREDDVNKIKINNVYNKIYNKQKLFKLCKKYNSFNEFKNKHKKEYRMLLKLKIVDEAAKHMPDKKSNIKLTINELKKIINKYNNLTDFRKNELRIYKHLKRTNKDYLISHLKRE